MFTLSTIVVIQVNTIVSQGHCFSSNILLDANKMMKEETKIDK